ncbi:MAG: eukaryotic translation initiation factor 4E [Alectoria sarmentosa]|nr:MAG: eukaryotic translation initiation factor 4E [Alectoria sarmentosa]
MSTSVTAPTTLKSNSPVPLDTIPISPANENADPNMTSEDGTIESNGAAKSGDEQVTVFHDPENFNVKHPLMHEWTLWFTKPPSGKGDNWNDLLKEVVTFDSVEEFWGVYANGATNLKVSTNIPEFLFQTDMLIKPPPDKRSAPIDELWLHVMLAAIGETLENNDDDGEVMGVVVNVRKGFYRVGLWTKTVGKSVPGGGEGDVAGGKGRSPEKSKDVLIGLGKKFKEVLKLKDAEVVEFSGHTESAHSGSTRAKAKFTV